MKKIYLLSLSFLLCLCLAFVLSGCGMFNNEDTSDDVKFTYTELEDGTYEISVGEIPDPVDPIIVIPTEYEGKAVTRIASEAFKDCTFIESITIPDTIRSIGQSAFAECVTIGKMYFSSSVVSFEAYAFENTTVKEVYYDGVILDWCNIRFEMGEDVSEVDSSDGVAHYAGTSTPLAASGHYSYEGTTLWFKSGKEWSELTSIAIPQTVSEIGDLQFCGFDKITELNLHNDIQKIGASAFAGCIELQNVTLPSSLKSLGDYAFSGCDKIKQIVLPSELTYLGAGAFSGCSSLSSITLNEKIDRINDWTFNSCNLNEIVIPDQITHIGFAAFEDCSNLKQITIGSGVNHIDERAFCYTGITNLTIPSNVKTIGKSAFENCHSLTDITFNEGLKEIGSHAFHYCVYLQEVVLPNTLESIGDSSFYECIRLTKVDFGDGLENIAWDSFVKCQSLNTIYLSKNIKTISLSAFWLCDIDDVYYSGSEAEWKLIEIADQNDTLHSATMHYNFEN